MEADGSCIENTICNIIAARWRPVEADGGRGGRSRHANHNSSQVIRIVQVCQPLCSSEASGLPVICCGKTSQQRTAVNMELRSGEISVGCCLVSSSSILFLLTASHWYL